MDRIYNTNCMPVCLLDLQKSVGSARMPHRHPSRLSRLSKLSRLTMLLGKQSLKWSMF